MLSSRLNRSISESVHYSRHNAPMVGVLGIISFPLYYFIWQSVFPQPYENLGLRLLGALICVPLLAYRFWPTRLQRYFAHYWVASLLYALPFFFTYMLLRNNMSLVWSMSTMAALFLLVLAVYDWLLVICLSVLGSLLGWLAFVLTADNTAAFTLYLHQLPIYAFVVLAGSIFNYTANMVKEEKLNAHAAIGRNIAHELRTPLSGMKGAIAGLVAYLPDLVQAHRLASEAGLPVRQIRANRMDQLNDAASRIQTEIDFSHTIIDMLLLSAGQATLKQDNFARYSINDTIRRAFDRYPFKSDREHELVQWQEGEDFDYYGSDLLLIHVLFNLTKNALHSVIGAGKGVIHVSTSRGADHNRLVFMDTGPGMTRAQVKQIFDYFYTSKTVDQGSGLGLSFCRLVMQSFDGSIRCESRLGEYTLFELTFPQVR
ncbi:sensor histidine kinase [Alcanivorax quisquiliarum]|uniref:histidine kinase n=1 Tax=Alcanivorax quisquiliarum TaxID=2933565 RepID=A0ABT0E6I1_9GAMM|nr:HAMP domain-containing sensor histidine kinase [Alcanivorax quisquiliarum]MCK0537433.1 HAMP domain-containing histidine kinase [Alcanivorax quisquiliarum]